MTTNKDYYQPQLETMPLAQLRQLQGQKLAAQTRWAWERVPAYRAMMQERGLTPDDIRGLDDLHKLPFLSKDDLRQHYPDGLLAVPLRECVRIHSTSGTTGRRVVVYYTQADIDMWYDCCARAIVAAGGGPQDVCQVCYGYGLFSGGAGLDGGSHKVGCLTLPMSTGNTERQLQFMSDLQATVLCCTPSYAAYLAEAMHEQGLSADDIPLRIGIFGAEPWTQDMRRDIEQSLGVRAYDIYGLTEMCGPGVAYECEAQDGMHVNEDHFLVEVIDPESGEQLPDGSKGELVFSSLDRQAFPLLRYRTRDIGVLTREPCRCGRTHVRMTKPLGRSDDMLIVRGVNVFPSQIETVLLQAGYAANYLIEIDRRHNTDSLDVSVELPPQQFSDTVRELETKQRELAARLKTMLGIQASVHLLPAKSLQRSEGKARRVVDKRQLI